MALFWGPPPVQEKDGRWRRARPGDGAYERAHENARAGAAFLAWIVTAYLPEDDIYLPQHPDDPDFDPDLAIGPHEKAVQDITAARGAPPGHGAADDDVMPGPMPTPGPPPVPVTIPVPPPRIILPEPRVVASAAPVGPASAVPVARQATQTASGKPPLAPPQHGWNPAKGAAP